MNFFTTPADQMGASNLNRKLLEFKLFIKLFENEEKKYVTSCEINKA